MITIRMLYGMAAALALAGLLCSAARAADEEKKEGKAQATCPVTGKAIDKAFFAEQDGKRVYFCCGDCPAMFAKDPAKYLKKLTDAGVTPEPAPAPKAP
jgi:YHS domain-containing protein